MNIFVINLKKDHERRESVVQQFKKLQITFSFISGILGKALTEEEIKESYNEKKTFRHLCRPLVLAEIGIALSHLSIYRKIVEENIQYACIFEDDVIIPENLGYILKNVESNLNNGIPEIVLLSPSNVKDKSVDIDSEYKISDFKSGVYASAYVINLLGAKALIKKLYPVSHVADCWTWLNSHKVVNIRAVVPSVVNQNQIEFGSSTTNDLRQNIRCDLSKTYKYKFCRIFWKTIDFLTALYHRSLSKF